MTVDTQNPLLSARGVGRIYADDTGADVIALAGLSLDIARHEFVSIVGPSGCGKSTFLRIVAGLDRPSAGSVVIEGRRITGPGADRGMVFQEYALLPWKTTIANVAFGLQLKGVPRAERLRIAKSYVDFVGLSDFETKYPHQLSGGMRQRAAVARALANSPALLLMDEPFAAIDALTRRRLQEEIGDILAKERITVLFITHSVDEAVFLSDRVVAMSGRPGRVLADLPVDIPRPRRWSDSADHPRFLAIREALLAHLGEDSAVEEAVT